MDQSGKENKNLIITITVLTLVILGYLLAINRSKDSVRDFASGVVTSAAMMVKVENTSAVNGIIPPPSGLPKDIPIELGKILDSATTNYPAENADQYSVSYETLEAFSEKYAEYKDYMVKAGFDIEEKDENTSIKIISGKKNDVILTVAVKKLVGKVLVEVSYFVKS